MQVFDKNRKENEIYKGDIYLCDLGISKDFKSSVQEGIRPVVVLQNNDHNKTGTTTIIAPVTSRKKKKLHSHVHINKGEGGVMVDSTILLEQLRIIDNYRLIKYLGSLDDDVLYKVEDALFAVLDL